MTGINDTRIKKARIAIEAQGWSVYETRIRPTPEGNCFLEIFKDGRKKAWGVHDRSYCWAEAYQEVIGSQWEVLDG
ncbi:hypothetical protein ACH42_04875 [Endozoicomonas sp. (ex Bugula neritina AB1)]|nr:hypothetical protein ACH42_04875 [Endozoicomonas sp. (ex Bugula neritina AB1)]